MPGISRPRRDGGATSRRRGLLPAIGLALAGAYLALLAAFGLAQQPRPGELAVVLGNTVLPDGTPSPRLQARLDAALRLYQAGTVRRVLVSGGIEEPGHRDEAAVMAAYLHAHGMPPGAVLADDAGIDTMATARHTAALMGPGGGVVVVSQWFHLPRAMLAMRRAGVGGVSGDWPRWFEARDIYSFLREAVALPVYAVRPLDRGAEGWWLGWSIAVATCLDGSLEQAVSGASLGATWSPPSTP